MSRRFFVKSGNLLNCTRASAAFRSGKRPGNGVAVCFFQVAPGRLSTERRSSTLAAISASSVSKTPPPPAVIYLVEAKEKTAIVPNAPADFPSIVTEGDVAQSSIQGIER